MNNVGTEGGAFSLEKCFVVATVLVVVTLLGLGRTAAGQSEGLKIVVLEGEGGINIVRQKTAVVPLVEVRDRNDQPVAGATVSFAIRAGRATFGGARTLTVTTNAAGRAAATGLTPTGSGALQIGASAAFQGQTAVTTIAQTNVLTAAQAATGAGAGGGGSGAGPGAGGAAGGGSGGGLSATTIAIVGGAAAGGTVALKEAGLLGGRSQDIYVGSFSGIFRYQVVASVGLGCSRDEQHTGEIQLGIEVSDNGSVGGEADLRATATVVTFTEGCAGPYTQDTYGCCESAPRVTGTAASLGFSASNPGAPGTTFTHVFTGTLTGTQIVGTYTETIRTVLPGGGTFGGTQTYPVTLTKQ